MKYCTRYRTYGLERTSGTGVTRIAPQFAPPTANLQICEVRQHLPTLNVAMIPRIPSAIRKLEHQSEISRSLLRQFHQGSEFVLLSFRIAAVIAAMTSLTTGRLRVLREPGDAGQDGIE